MLQHMKAVLEYMAGQEAALEDTAAQVLALEELSRTLTEAVFSPEVLRGLIYPDHFQFVTYLPILGKDSMSIVDFNAIELTHSSSREFFEERLRSITALAPETVDLRTWNMSLKALIDDYFAALRLMSIRYFYHQTQDLSPSCMELMKEKVEQVGLAIDRELWAKYKYCEGKCQNCYLTCSLPIDHDSTCTCLTSHKCTETCQDCPFGEMCAVPAGHREDHSCD